MALSRIKVGVNTKTFAPIYYLEARLTQKLPWRIVAEDGKVFTTRSQRVATRECVKLEKRLQAKAA
jgi:hypothetical protein